MGAAATDIVCGYGRLNFKSWPMSLNFPLRFAICRREPASATTRASFLFVYHHQLARKTTALFRTIVPLIAATTTDSGLKVRVVLDESKYPKGVKVSGAQLAAVNLPKLSFRGCVNASDGGRRGGNAVVGLVVAGIGAGDA
jgi:hypothetical protein